MSNLLVPAPSKGSDSVLFALGRPRNLGAFLPRLAQPDRDRLLATLDRGPAPPALQRPVLLLMHRALDRLLRGLSVSRHDCFPPGCGVLSLERWRSCYLDPGPIARAARRAHRTQGTHRRVHATTNALPR